MESLALLAEGESSNSPGAHGMIPFLPSGFGHARITMWSPIPELAEVLSPVSQEDERVLLHVSEHMLLNGRILEHDRDMSLSLIISLCSQVTVNDYTMGRW